MQKSVVQSIKNLCGVGKSSCGPEPSGHKLPKSVVDSVLFFAKHIPDSFPPPTPTLYPPDKLTLEWWCGQSSCVKIIFQDSKPVSYEIKTSDGRKTGKMMPPSEFAQLLNSVLQES